MCFAANLTDLLTNPLICEKIFSNLSAHDFATVRFVSKFFYQKVLEYLLSTSIVSNTDPMHYQNDGLIQMSTLWPTKVPYLKGRTSPHKLSRDCNDLKSIHLTQCHWLEDQHLLKYVTTNYHTLQALYLDSCWNVTNEALEGALASCSNIRRLSLANIYSVEDQLLSLIGNRLARLEWLNLRHCWRITDQGVR